MVQVEVNEDHVWPPSDWQALADRAVTAVFAAVELSIPNAEIAIRLTTNPEMRALNRDYRGKDTPTNVLSFPQYAPDEISGLATRADPEILLGDIVLALETCADEAIAKDIPFWTHVGHLMVHGTLHLLGHDHQDDASAEAMEALEVKALASLLITNPYL